jgi:hypothetical protein
MKTIDEMTFDIETRRDRKFVGHVREFPDLHTRPKRTAMDAISDIVTITAERIADIHEAQNMQLNGR